MSNTSFEIRTPYNKISYKKVFDEFISAKSKELSKAIYSDDYKRILKGFRFKWRHETAQFKHRILKIRDIKRLYDDDGSVYLDAETKLKF